MLPYFIFERLFLLCPVSQRCWFVAVGNWLTLAAFPHLLINCPCFLLSERSYFAGNAVFQSVDDSAITPLFQPAHATTWQDEFMSEFSSAGTTLGVNKSLHVWRDCLAERVLSHFLKPSQEDITKPLLNESVVISSISRATKNVFTGYIMFLSDSLQYRAVR